MTGPPLSSAAFYSLIQRLLGARGAHRRFVEDHVRPSPGDRVLDLGCGPADILVVLPEVDYSGVDASGAYIAAAQRRHGGRGSFRRADVLSLDAAQETPFDVVIAVGLLHHLDDDEATRLLAIAGGVLKDDGRLVTMDPGFPGADAPRVFRRLVAWDRGSHFRGPDDYRALAAPFFGSVGVTVRDGLARVPYLHSVLECGRPRRAAADAVAIR